MRPKKLILLVGLDDDWLGRTRFLLTILYRVTTCSDLDALAELAEDRRFDGAVVLMPKGTLIEDPEDYACGDLPTVLYREESMTVDFLSQLSCALRIKSGPKPLVPEMAPVLITEAA